MKKSFAACLLALPLLSACYNPVLHALYPDKKIFGSPQALFAKAPAKPGDYPPPHATTSRRKTHACAFTAATIFPPSPTKTPTAPPNPTPLW